MIGRAHAAAAIVLLVATASGPAQAFHEVGSFARTANSGGGAGSYFTGSPRWKSYNCLICHTDAPGLISINVASEPPELFAEGRYQPGTAYLVSVGLVGETRGLESAFNPNTFTADFLDFDAEPFGELAQSTDTIVEIVADGTVALAEGFGRGEISWSFVWTAPASGVAGRFHIAMLDGDGASDADRRFIDPFNDDVAFRVIELCPVGQECAPRAADGEPTSPAGCQGSAPPGDVGLLALLAVFAILGLRRRPRTRSV